ncbi:MAG: hypothetical protein GAK31_00153 [Stenotrophomonas maltophilia]|uniref:General secretion pathway protein GspK n=1 Tax=Stenotrophomonas maltophilia TaxID=40324 RepID=A0A7V8FIW8_STEMA|nr:MAG: hypothetical protein GAK31_00153 [Stenotrophomonas maltophilia]
MRAQLATVLQGRWAQPLQLQAPLPVHLQLVDAQGLFNLRNLLREGRPDSVAVASFVQLCTAQGLGRGECEAAVTYLQARLRDDSWSAQAPLPREDALQLALAGANATAVQALVQRTVMLPAHTLLNANTSDASIVAATVGSVEPARLQALLGERDRGAGSSTAATSPTACT